MSSANSTKQADIRPYTHQFFRGNGVCFVLGMMTVAVVVATQLWLARIIQQLLDLIGGVDIGASLFDMLISTICVIGLCVLSSLLNYLSSPRFVARGSAQYRSFVFEKLSQKSISAFTGENTSLYISALSNDIGTIETDYLGNIFTIVQLCAQLVATLLMMLWYSPILTVVSLVFSLFPVLTTMLIGNRYAQSTKAVSDKNEAYLSSLRDALTGFSVIKSFRAEVQMCKLFAAEVKALMTEKEKNKKLYCIIGLFSELGGITVQMGVFFVGAYLALGGKAITPGTVLVFVQLLNYVLSPIQNLPTCFAQRKAALALVQKVADALEENVREEGTAEAAELTEGITLQNLSFSYEPEKPVLQSIDFTFEAGKSYALVGASGSGKSTLLNLLMASSPDYDGSISFDGTELRDLRSEALYGLMSAIQQNVFLFNASLRDNITMFADFPEEEIDRAIALSGLSALVEEKGKDYLCGENGCGLSGGEKQRVSIARSLLKRSQVLLVDEATAALDPQTAYQVSSALLDLKDITRIVVTHDLDGALLKRYDCILTLKNGTLTEVGSFEELMAQKGYFYSLYTVAQ